MGAHEEQRGRPQAFIDWKIVDELLEAGCPGTEIADSIGINQNTLYDRCNTDNGITFSHYSQLKSAKGEHKIRQKQYQKAIDGDNTLLIWLGKVRLKQTENQQITPDNLADAIRKALNVESPKE